MNKALLACAFSCVSIICASSSGACLQKWLFHIGPDSEEVSVTARRAADGRIEFTVRRDPEAARFTRRDAQLDLCDSSGLIATCPVTHAIDGGW